MGSIRIKDRKMVLWFPARETRERIKPSWTVLESVADCGQSPTVILITAMD